MLVVGWMPGYLVFNATGPAKYRGKNANHFSPTAVFFKPEDYWLIVQTDIAFFTCVGLIGFASYTFGKLHPFYLLKEKQYLIHNKCYCSFSGFLTVGAFYLIPLMITNLFLVLITYLQHTDVFMPHFRSKEWFNFSLIRSKMRILASLACTICV